MREQAGEPAGNFGRLREWLAGDFGAATVGMGVVMLAVTLVSCAWSLEEN